MTLVLLKSALESLYSWQCLSLFDNTDTLAVLTYVGYKVSSFPDLLTSVLSLAVITHELLKHMHAMVSGRHLEACMVLPVFNRETYNRSFNNKDTVHHISTVSKKCYIWSEGLEQGHVHCMK